MSHPRGSLQRRLGPVLLTLYGTGVTVGAGIYVLVGAVAAHAGRFTPFSFLIAAIVMGLTVASYAELCTRFPVAAGEAAYVRAAFRARWLSTATGLVMIISAVVASATVAIGTSGYVAQFVDLPRYVVISGVVITIALVAAWGVLESVIIASLFTIIEVGGLLAIIAAGWIRDVPIASALFAVPPLDPALWSGVAFASLLAFFAFIGFEDLTNMAEETIDPERVMPKVLGATLLLTTLIYMLVAATAVSSLPIEELAASEAPLSLVFTRIVGINPATISMIAIIATFNTILAEMTMATRVLYGLARQGDLHDVFGRVHQRTSTPLVATGAIAVAVLALAVFAPLLRLAEFTSLATLTTFALVNASLLRLRWQGHHTPGDHLQIPLWIPASGFATSLMLMAAFFL